KRAERVNTVPEPTSNVANVAFRHGTPRGASPARDARTSGCGIRPRIGDAALIGGPVGASLGTARRLERRDVGARNGGGARRLDVEPADYSSLPSACQALIGVS